MHYASGNLNQIYPQLVNQTLQLGTKETQRGLTTRELHPVVFELPNPRRRLVSAYGRPVNVAFALAEVLWILGGRRDVGMLSEYNSRIYQYSDNGKIFNAAYGYRLRHAHGYDQIEDVVKTLRDDPGSRQATMVIWHPDDRGFWNNESKNETKDRACNLVSHFLLRSGQLDLLQIMRSNDAIWGTPYNVMQWTHVQEYVAGKLGVEVGKYTHVADSFHVYDPPLDGSELPDVSEFDIYNYLDDHEFMDVEHVETALEIEWMMRTSDSGRVQSDPVESVGRYWSSVLHVLAAHYHYKRERDYITYQFLRRVRDTVLAAAQCRFYWHQRWRHNDDPAMRNAISRDFMPELRRWIYGEK